MQCSYQRFAWQTQSLIWSYTGCKKFCLFKDVFSYEKNKKQWLIRFQTVSVRIVILRLKNTWKFGQESKILYSWKKKSTDEESSGFYKMQNGDLDSSVLQKNQAHLFHQKNADTYKRDMKIINCLSHSWMVLHFIKPTHSKFSEVSVGKRRS